MKEGLDDDREKTHDDQHIQRWERRQTATADVVAHQIARARQQLKERVGERAGVHAPKLCDILLDGLPPHSTHLSTLAAARTVVVGKLGAAVMAMLHFCLMAIDILRHFLLPTAEAAVIRY